jgi:hypothetical protein
MSDEPTEGPPPSEPDEPLSWRDLGNPWRSVPVRMLSFVAAVYLMLRLATPYIGSPGSVTGAGLSAIAFVFLALAIAYCASRAHLGLRNEVAAFVTFAGLWAVLAFVLAPVSGAPLISEAATDFCFLFAAVMFGLLLSRIFPDKNILLPVCLAAVVVDVITVYYGPTSRALENAPEVFRALSLSVPAMGAAGAPTGAPPLPVISIGIGDLVFVSAFFAAASRFELAPRRTFWHICPLVLGGVLVTVLARGDVALPGLVLIAGGFLWANFREFDLSPGERWAMLYAGLVVAVVIGLCLFAARYM